MITLHTAKGSFKITVVDTTPPVISGIAEFIEMEATGYYSAAPIPEGFTAVDIVDGDCMVYLWPTHAPLGVSSITLVAWDKSGNKGQKTIVVKVNDTTAPDISMKDYYEVETENGSDGTYIDWYMFIKKHIVVCDNTGIKRHGVQKATESQSEFIRASYLEAGIVERFNYVCTDYGDNTSVREFSLGVKMTTPSEPIAKEKKDIKIIIYPEEAGESRVIEVAASDIAIDKNLDELFCVDVLENSDASVADTEITADRKLKITTKTPGRTDITVQVSDGQDTIPVTIPVKVYDTSEALLPPQAIVYTPYKIPLRGSLELEVEDIATDANGEYLYFDGNVRSVNPYAVSPAISDGKLVIEGLSSSSVMVYATVTDGHESTEVAVPITVNSLPEFAMDLEKTYPQFIRSEVDMKVLDVEVAQGVDIRVETGKFFRDVDKDNLTIEAIHFSSPDKVSVSQEGEDLIFRGLNIGTSVITLNVSDGMQTAVFTINTTVAPRRASRIMVNTMPTDYPYVGDNRPELGLDGMSIDVVYNDGKVETVEYTNDGNWQVIGYQGSDIKGPQKVTLKWGDLSVQFNVYVYEMQFGSLMITDLYPQWYVGDTAQKMLEKNGLKVRGIPPGGSVDEMREILIGPGNIKGFDTSHPSDSVPVWVEFGGRMSDVVYVRVLPIEMTRIELALEGVSYPDIVPSTIEGNPLDLTGWDITGVFNNGEKRKLDAKEVEIKNFDSSTSTFNLAYKGVYEAVYETFDIDFISEPFYAGVQPNVPVSIELNTLPEKTAYRQGDSYDSVRLDGLTFLVRYADGKTAVLPYHHEDIEIDITAFDTRLPNKTHLGIWVQLNQKGFILREEFVIPIEVVRNALTELEIVQLPAKRQFYEWVGVSENDFSDLIVKGTYENGKVVNPMPLTASNFTIDRRPGEDRIVTVAVDNEKVSFTIDIEPLKVTELKLISPPEEKNYYVGESLNKRGMKVEYTYNSGEKVVREDFQLDDSNFSGFDSRTPVMGQEVTYKVGDKSVSFTVNVQEYKLMGLRIDRLPYREWFYQYEELSLEGMKLTGIWPYGEERDMENILWEISGFDSSKPVQDQEVTIRIEDQTVSFKVDILPPEEVISLDFSSTIYTEYLLGEPLNMDGHNAVASYAGRAYNPQTGEVEPRQFGVNIYPTPADISGFDSSQPATGQVLSYTFGEKTATFTVDILEPELLSLRVIPSRTTYYTGDVLKPEELTVLCSYANGYVRTMPADSYLISGFNSSGPVTEQEVTVSYKGKSDTFVIQVLPLELKSISVNPGLTNYYLGEQFNRSMLRVSAHYNSGAIKAVSPELVQISGFDSSREATGQEVVVSYQGKQDSFLVNILSGTRPGEGPGEEPGNESGNNSGSGGYAPGSTGGTTTPPSDGENIVTVQPSLDKVTGKVTASVDGEKLKEAFNKLDEDEEGVRKISIEIPTVEEAKAYVAELPSSFLTEKGAEIQMEIKTGVGTVTVPGNMLANIPEAFGKTAGITIGQGDKSALPEDVQSAIGDRPLVQLTLSLDGEQTEWNNPYAPVTVSVPYTPTAKELENPESIVVWYIDGNGNVISVPNGRYDPATGTVSFTTTHFSYYAVSYKPVSFKDVVKDSWYAKAVSFIAARGITTGTGGGNFSPEDKLTRGQFIVMMMRAYGIAPDEDPEDNFKDAGNTWYTGYLAAAKRLGISAGVGNNLFAPENAITRQEMFTLLYNGLKVIEKLPRGNSGKTLSDFSDADEIAPWAMDAMKLLVETGMVSGSGNKLSPKDITTRGQMAQVFYNLLSR